MSDIKDIKCFALDMDGTIYLGTKWIDGAVEFLEAVKASGRDFYFLTNNSSKNPDAYVQKLHNMGFETTRDRVITSGDATIACLKNDYAGQKVYLLGNSLLQKQFRDEKIALVTEDELVMENGATDVSKVDVVVVAFDTELDYKKMCIVCDLVRAGLPYLSTHPDFNCPTENGFIPDAGAIHAFIEASSGRRPDTIIGKPNAGIADYLVQRTGYKRSEIAMVGDRLYTDVATGVNNGMTGILVLSGEATMDTVRESDVKPHMIFDSVKEMIPRL